MEVKKISLYMVIKGIVYVFLENFLFWFELFILSFYKYVFFSLK